MSLKMLFIPVVVDCNSPNSTGVIFDPFNSTKFGTLITFHCEENDLQVTAVCGSDGEWDPDPTSRNCPTTAPGIESCITLVTIAICLLLRVYLNCTLVSY